METDNNNNNKDVMIMNDNNKYTKYNNSIYNSILRAIFTYIKGVSHYKYFRLLAENIVKYY